jgi:predicted O-linked N-acetylglucosamine transferase (SPINDLY family)
LAIPLPHPNEPSRYGTVAEAIDAAIALHRQGRLNEAEVLYRRVLEADAKQADALYLLGRLELQRGNFETARTLVQMAIAVDPSAASFHNCLGDAWRGVNDYGRALSAYREAVRLQPDYAVAHQSIGQLLGEQSDFAGAESAFGEALRHRPEFPEALNNLAVVLRKMRRWDEAALALQKAVQLRPDFFEAHFNLGNLLNDARNTTAAIDAYRRAVALRPREPDVLLALANALRETDRHAEALAAIQQALVLQPDNVEGLTNLAIAHADLGMIDEAVDICRRAVSLDPTRGRPHSNLASWLLERGEADLAIDHCRQAIALDPQNPTWHASYIYGLLYSPHVDDRTIFEEHRRWGSTFADPTPKVVGGRTRDCSPERRLRIGYVSPYFREHAIMVFVEGILKHHSHDAFEVICYSDLQRPDAGTERLRQYSDQWVDTACLSDAELAQRIVDDRIDLAVDLTGHLPGSRLLAFARRPAPVQITYMGYQHTTGMAEMDYRLTDDFADPPGMTEACYTESLVRLPGSFFCYQPDSRAPEVNPLPAIDRGFVTFGSFNKLQKVNVDVLATWATVLAQVADSRLLILGRQSGEMVNRLHRVFAEHGVGAERVQFAKPRARCDYLALHHEVDVALDAFPFNGHTTTCEALWMGVPVVMLAGMSYVTRFGGSALSVLGLTDCISANRDEYVAAAARLAGDVSMLQQLRQTLRGRMAASVLCDAAGFTRSLELAYRQMWTKYCETVS